MAYVAISGELLNTVRAGIQMMARKELDTVGEVPKLEGTESFVEPALWGPYAHLRSQMPKEWKRTAGSITLRIQFPDSVWQEAVPFKNGVEAPPSYSPYDAQKVTVLHDLPEIAPIVTAISNRRDAKRRWDGVERQVMDFINKCKSLNEALKLWPDLRMYIPKPYLDRVERKVERTKDTANAAMDVLKSMNTDEIVAAAVIARMSTGKTDET
jgi:hypothetical protein